MLSIYPNIYRATSTNVASFTLDPTPAITPITTVTWANQEVFNPAATCEDAGPFGYSSYFGGRTLSSWAIADAGWGKGISSDGASWFLNESPYYTWDDDLDWRRGKCCVSAPRITWCTSRRRTPRAFHRLVSPTRPRRGAG